jgi:hypothetical protein
MKDFSAVYTRTIVVDEVCLKVVFNPDEVKLLLNLGKTSFMSRSKLLRDAGVNEKDATDTASLLADLYFAANKFNKDSE